MRLAAITKFINASSDDWPSFSSFDTECYLTIRLCLKGVFMDQLLMTSFLVRISSKSRCLSSIFLTDLFPTSIEGNSLLAQFG